MTVIIVVDGVLKQNQDVLKLSEHEQTGIADLCTEIRKLYHVARVHQRVILSIIGNNNNN